MKIELRGVNPLNKGAELMLVAMQQMLLEHGYSDISLGVGPGNTESYCRLNGLKKVAILQKKIVQIFQKPKSEIFISPYELDVVLDGSGFAYGDQWGVQESFVLYRYLRKIKKNNSNVKVILMPQALGPFENKLVNYFTSKAFSYADAVFARDKQSYSFLSDLNLSKTKVLKSPDFTNLVKVPVDLDFDVPGDVCIVPNSKMIQKGGVKSEKDYLYFISKAISKVINSQLSPFILVHDKGPDLELAKKLRSEFLELYGIELPLLIEDSPLIIKYIIGQSKVLVGSRFHSLVSALSQGVPVIATGWSHKYVELLNDYGVSDYLVDLNENVTADCIVDKLIKNRDELAKIINEFSIKEKEKSKKMWESVFEIIEGN